MLNYIICSEKRKMAINITTWKVFIIKYKKYDGSISKEVIGNEGLCALPRQNDKQTGEGERRNKRSATFQDEGFAKGKHEVISDTIIMKMLKPDEQER